MTISDQKHDKDQRAGNFRGLGDTDDPTWWTSALVRFCVIPTIVALILTSGVYWMWHLPSGEPAAEAETSSVEVRLLPTPEPTPFATQKAVPTQRRGETPTTSSSESDESDANLFPPPQSSKVDVADDPDVPDTDVPRASDFSNQPAAMFQQTLLRHLARFQRYPDLARQERLQGTVHLSFILRRDGTVSGAWINSGSGAKVLDQEAVDMIRRAEPFPQIPGQLPDPLSIKLPVIFALP